MSSASDRFMRYISIDTQSDPGSGSTPSTSKQFRLAKLLAEEMTAMGVSDVRYDEEHCYVYGEIPATREGNIPAVGFIAHMDTAPDAPGDASGARTVTDYDGGVIKLSDSVSLDPESGPGLKNYVGCDLIVTDGVSLLGADDKAGIAEIMTMAERLISDPSIPHGRIGIAFTSDEEICGNARFFDIEGFGMDFAYTVDGGAVGEIEYENFNAAEAFVRVRGRNIHPGDAKDVMINAVRIAAEFDSLLPQAERPEHTEGYEGFFHLSSLSGDVTEAEARYIIRDHDDDRFSEKIGLMKKCADYLNAKYKNAVELVIHEQYRNMKKLIVPHMFLIDNAIEAFTACGVEPLVRPIRGGTDGAMLTYRGLPCPNLSTGGHNFHSNTEYIPVQSLEKMADVLVKLASLPAS